jgi:hypothetical protein
MGSGLDWIYWNFFTITINYNSSQSVTVQNSLHSLLDYKCLLFCVTDLVLIYESVTPSASVVRWLAIHSWTLKFSLMSEWKNDFTNNLSFFTLGGPMRGHHTEQSVFWSLVSLAAETPGDPKKSIPAETLFVDSLYPRKPLLDLCWHENAF